LNKGQSLHFNSRLANITGSAVRGSYWLPLEIWWKGLAWNHGK